MREVCRFLAVRFLPSQYCDCVLSLESQEREGAEFIQNIPEMQSFLIYSDILWSSYVTAIYVASGAKHSIFIFSILNSIISLFHSLVEPEVSKHPVSARHCARHLRILEYTYLRTMERPKRNYYHSSFLINKEL